VNPRLLDFLFQDLWNIVDRNWAFGIIHIFKCECDCTMIKRSQLQKQVLSLYRSLLRAGQGTPGLNDYIRNEFKSKSLIKKTSFLQIEHLIRLGRKKLKEIKNGSLTSMGRFRSWLVECTFVRMNRMSIQEFPINPRCHSILVCRSTPDEEDVN